MKAPTCQPNFPDMAGRSASRKTFFGPFSRYAVYAVHTRFDAVCWFVSDGETIDQETGLLAIIRQAETFEQAIAGLA